METGRRARGIDSGGHRRLQSRTFASLLLLFPSLPILMCGYVEDRHAGNPAEMRRLFGTTSDFAVSAAVPPADDMSAMRAKRLAPESIS